MQERQTDGMTRPKFSEHFAAVREFVFSRDLHGVTGAQFASVAESLMIIGRLIEAVENGNGGNTGKRDSGEAVATDGGQHAGGPQ